MPLPLQIQNCPNPGLVVARPVFSPTWVGEEAYTDVERFARQKHTDCIRVLGVTIFATRRRQFSDTRDHTEGLASFIIIRTLLVVFPVKISLLIPHYNSPDSGIPHKKKQGA